MNLKVKEENGITLIALVITINVLLILAGVTIATLTGDNGLLKKTNEAEFKNQISTYKEELRISIYSDTTEKLGERNYKFNAKGYDEVRKLIPSFQKKDENILEVKEDKLIYIGKNKNEYRMAVDMDLISDDELIDDEIIEELQPFITEWTVEDGDSITLPINEYAHNRYNFTVDYGDGSEVKVVDNYNDEDKTHIYEKAGIYVVTIKGQCPSFQFNRSNDTAVSKDKISRIVQWGNVFKNGGGIKFGMNINFCNCTNLTGPIPKPTKNSFVNLCNVKSLFCNCTKLTGEIPENLFYNCENITDFSYIFSNCPGVIEIPKGLFKNCTNSVYFMNSFSGCENLKEIPKDLFYNCKKVTSFSGAFSGCISITEIPDDLFANCDSASSFRETFLNCKSLVKVGNNIFKSGVSMDFYRLFENCVALTTVPNELFLNCTGENNGYERTFRNCTKLNSLPLMP